MKRPRAKQIYFFIGLGAFVLSLGLLAFLIVGGFPDGLKSSFIKTLVKIEPALPASIPSLKESNTVIYVLGGSQPSLENRFKTAADLYHQGMAFKIFILSRTGMTVYSPIVGRNLTNNEWATEKLVSLGVPKEDIELVKLEKRFFGTFSEAEGISNLVLNRGYKTLILVSSQSHTMRVWESFSKFVKNKKLNLFIYAANDHPSVYSLLQEYLKLKFYKLFLL